MRTFNRSASAAGFTIVALALSASLTASTTVDDLPTSRGVSPTQVVEPSSVARPQLSEELVADIAAITAEGGRTQQELDSLVWQEDFAIAITEIQEQYPEFYTSSWLDRESGEFWVSVPGELATDVEEILSGVGTTINVVESIGWTESEFTAAIQASHYEVLEHDGVMDASTGGDPLTGAIEIDVQLGGTARLDVRELTAIGQQAIPDQSKGDFSVSVSSGLDEVGELDWLRGGSQLGNGCTAAFSVRSSSYDRGIMSAAHCSNDADIGTNNLTHRGSADYSVGDVEWYSSNQTTYSGFYADASTVRETHGSANPVDGNTYCRFGRTTGYECDSVYMLNRCRSSYCGLVMMFNREADDGDSGGPWFSGNTAYGVHSGGVTYLLLWRDVWSPIRAAMSDMGVTLKLS